MKQTKIIYDKAIAGVIIDNSLAKYTNKILFPEKLANANEMLKTARLLKKAN